MRLVARLTLVAMSAGLDGGNLGLVTIGAALPPACSGWGGILVRLMTEGALVRPPLCGSRFCSVAIVTSLDVGDLMVLVTIDARTCMCRASGPQRCNSPLVLVARGALLRSYLRAYVRLVAIPTTAVWSIRPHAFAYTFVTA